MKVIAKINSDRVLCEVSVEELARLLGHHSQYDNNFDGRESMAVGVEHDITPGFRALDTLRALDNNQFQRTSDDLERLLESFITARNSFQGLMLFDTLKTAGKKEDVL